MQRLAPNIYGKIYVMMKFDGNNYIPYTIGVNGDKKLDISLNTTISTNEHDSSHELAEQSAIDCLSAYYSERISILPPSTERK